MGAAMTPRAKRNDNSEFWDRPQLMNLIADLLLLGAMLALGYSALLAVARLPFFPLRELRVAGSLHEVTATQLDYATRAAASGNFFTVNLEAVRIACEKLPWVRKASVRRRWPQGLDLHLEEHVAAARWKQGDGAETRLVNSEGEVFAASSSAALPVFSGPEGTAPQIVARYREFTELLAPLGRKPKGVALSPRQAWQVRLDDGVLLDIGRDQAKSGVRERLTRFVAVYGETAERLRRRADVIDLRYPNGFAARLARAGND
jgi:cell division protein FtsQ